MYALAFFTSSFQIITLVLKHSKLAGDILQAIAEMTFELNLAGVLAQ